MATLWRWHNGSLHPASAAAKRMAQEWADAHEITIDVMEQRNLKFHRMFFAFGNLVCNAVNRGPFTMTTIELVKWLKIRMGYVDVVELPPVLAKIADQSYAIEYQSISFAKMDQPAFYAFASEAARLICDQLAPYIMNAPEWPEINGLIATFAPDQAA